MSILHIRFISYSLDIQADWDSWLRDAGHMYFEAIGPSKYPQKYKMTISDQFFLFWDHLQKCKKKEKIFIKYESFISWNSSI